MRDAIIPTVLHTVELVVVLFAVFFAVKLFGLEVDPTLPAVVVAAIVKFARTATNDYVNN